MASDWLMVGAIIVHISLQKETRNAKCLANKHCNGLSLGSEKFHFDTHDTHRENIEFIE